MKKGATILLLLLNCIFCCLAMGQQKQYKALFLGNSYTYVNDLPGLISQLAASTGDQLTTGSNTIGGYTFQQHASNTTTLGLIDQGTWDYVILQEQSQRPSFPYQQVMAEVFPYAGQLVERIKEANPCAKPVFYMTWGRKSGDRDICPYLPQVCTYTEMDDRLQFSYTVMAVENESVLCPVAKVWRYLRAHYPAIELYQGDESHPSMEGSYAAACAFYSVLFKKDPALCTYSSSLSDAQANILRNAAKLVIYDSLDSWTQFYPYAKSGYSYTTDAKEVTFSNESENADTYHWDFGDGNSSTEINPVHLYGADGLYQVKLITSRCGESHTELKSIQVGTPTDIHESQNDLTIKIYPNPAGEKLYLESTAPITEVLVSTLTGQTVKQFSVSSASATLEIQELENSFYFLTIRSGQKTIHTKFYKK